MSAQGRLILIPTPIGDGDPLRILPPEAVEAVRGIRHFVVESERTAGRVLSRILTPEEMQRVSFRVLDEHTPTAGVPELLEPALAGHDLGLLSEAGCPCVADPGSDLVAEAHRMGVRVVPHTGPSSILQALMASGFSGQRFLFLGYIPARTEERAGALKRMEREARADGGTRIFIEAPYRNAAVLQDALRVLDGATRLCVAASLGGAEERIRSSTVEEWRSCAFILGKEPAVFLLAPPAAGFAQTGREKPRPGLRDRAAGKPVRKPRPAGGGHPVHPRRRPGA